jgi:hypothetical protein
MTDNPLMITNQMKEDKTESHSDKKMYSYTIYKVGLTSKYDKRKLAENKINTYPLDI